MPIKTNPKVKWDPFFNAFKPFIWHRWNHFDFIESMLNE